MVAHFGNLQVPSKTHVQSLPCNPGLPMRMQRPGGPCRLGVPTPPKDRLKTTCQFNREGGTHPLYVTRAGERGRTTQGKMELGGLWACTGSVDNLPIPSTPHTDSSQIPDPQTPL